MGLRAAAHDDVGLDTRVVDGVRVGENRVDEHIRRRVIEIRVDESADIAETAQQRRSFGQTRQGNDCRLFNPLYPWFPADRVRRGVERA